MPERRCLRPSSSWSLLSFEARAAASTLVPPRGAGGEAGGRPTFVVPLPTAEAVTTGAVTGGRTAPGCAPGLTEAGGCVCARPSCFFLGLCNATSSTTSRTASSAPTLPSTHRGCRCRKSHSAMQSPVSPNLNRGNALAALGVTSKLTASSMPGTPAGTSCCQRPIPSTLRRSRFPVAGLAKPSSGCATTASNTEGDDHKTSHAS